MPPNAPVELTDQSPKVTFELGREIRVDRVFAVPVAQDPVGFAVGQLGQPDPSIPHVYCVRADVERMLGDYAQVRLSYSTESSQNDRSVGDRPGSISFRLTVRGGGEFMLFPARDLRWEDNVGANPAQPIPDQDSQSGRILVPRIEYRIMAENVINPPLANLAAKVGCVNQGMWLGWPSEVVLFESYSMDYSWTMQDNSPQVTWNVEMTFVARPIRAGSQVYGWNHEYRGPDGWRRVMMFDGSQWGPRYPLAFFGDIFP